MAGLGSEQPNVFALVCQSMFVVNAAAPVAGEFVLELSRLPRALERRSLDLQKSGN